MRAYTFHRPWISGAILAPVIPLGPKRLENRWTLPPECIRGKRFALHSGKVFDPDAAAAICSLLGYHADGGYPAHWETQGIVATAVCIGWITRSPDGLFCVTTIDSDGRLHHKWERDIGAQQRWWREPPSGSKKRNCAWMLDDVRTVPEPIRIRGAQGPWIVPPDVEAQLYKMGAA